MTAAEIKEYKQMVQGSWSLWYQKNFKNKIECISLHGFTSCSLKKSNALSFAWENPQTGHSKVLFHIKWNSVYWAYFLDSGAYDFEEEVLLFDGTALYVESVQKVNNEKGKLLYTLITLNDFIMRIFTF